jgi:hypothetical protein
MEMPFFSKDQPGETYYYMLKSIILFGVVDCNPVKEVLYAYDHGEEHSGQGGKNVASLFDETSQPSWVVGWHQKENPQYHDGQLLGTKQEQLCRGSFHILIGRRPYKECCQSSVQYSEKTLPDVEYFQHGHDD